MKIFRIPYDDAGGVCQHRDSGMTANTNQPLTLSVMESKIELK